jgi:sn-glycerol 3-phosphate transport system substrate-binding protein
MSTVSDLYPNDGFLAGVALVVLAICVTSAVALLIARLFEHRPAVQHTVLASALICTLATPLIAILIRTSGTSTFVWNVLPAVGIQSAQGASAEGQSRPGSRLQSGNTGLSGAGLNGTGLNGTGLNGTGLNGTGLKGAGLKGAGLNGAGLDSAIINWLVTLWRNDGRMELPRSRPESSTADAAHTTLAGFHRAVPLEGMDANPTAAAGSAGWHEAIRVGLTLSITVWLAGSAILFVRLARSSVKAWRICRSGKPFHTDVRGAVATGVLRCLETDRLPTILLSDAIESPVATGLFRGAVILPAGLISKITNDQLCDVLVHECAHVVRRDPLMLYLQVAAGSLFWPIPLVHWLNRQLTAACEEICDNYVIAHRDPLRYAETLLLVASLVGQGRRRLPFVGMLHWRGKFESRIAGLIDENRNRSTRIPGPRAGLCLVAFLLASVAICGTTIQAERTDATPPEASQPPKAAEQQADAPATADAPPKAETPRPPAVSTAAEARPKLAEKPAQPTQIQIWWGMRGNLGGAFEKQVKQFNESQDRIHANVRLFDGYAALHTELNHAFREGGLPDAAAIEIHHVAAFAVDQRISPLDEFIQSDPSFEADDLLPGILTNLRYQDKLYALPMNRSTPILYYNKDRFAAAGLDPDKPPATWQEVREMSGRLTSDDGSQYGFVAATSPWFFESMVWSNGGQLLVDGKPTFAEHGAGPLQLWADMVHLDHTARFFKNGFGEFASGRAAMVVESTALLPRSEGSPNAVPTGGGAAVIPAKNSPEQKAAAWAFMTWFIKTQQAADWSEATGYIPVRESARTLLRTEGFYDKYPQFEVAIKQMAFAREAPPLPQWGEIWKIIGDSMTSVVRDDEPALRTLKLAEKKVEIALNPEETPKP